MIDFSTVSELFVAGKEAHNLYINGSKVWEKGGQPAFQFTGLKLIALSANSTVKLQRTGNPPTVYLNYSLDEGLTWNTYTIGDTITLSNQGDSVCFVASQDNSAFANSTSSYHTFVMTGDWKAEGDLNSMLFTNYVYPGTYTNRALYRLFQNCAAITDVEDLELKADSVPSTFYAYLLAGTSITKGPKIYASSASSYAFAYMFSGCSSLSEIKLLNYTNAIPNNVNGPFQYWVRSVASIGTFYYNGTSHGTGTSSIPTGWTVQSF